MEIYIYAAAILIIAIVIEECRLWISREKLNTAHKENMRLHDDILAWHNKYHTALVSRSRTEEQYYSASRGKDCCWEIEDTPDNILQDYKLHPIFDGAYVVLRKSIDWTSNDYSVVVANIYPYYSNTKTYARNCAEELLEKLSERIEELPQM